MKLEPAVQADRHGMTGMYLYVCICAFLTCCLLFCIAEFLTLEPWRKFRREGEKEEEEGRILAELLRKIDRSYS